MPKIVISRSKYLVMIVSRLDGRFDHGMAVGGKTLGGGMTSPDLNNQFGNLVRTGFQATFDAITFCWFIVRDEISRLAF